MCGGERCVGVKSEGVKCEGALQGWWRRYSGCENCHTTFFLTLGRTVPLFIILSILLLKRYSLHRDPSQSKQASVTILKWGCI